MNYILTIVTIYGIIGLYYNIKGEIIEIKNKVLIIILGLLIFVSILLLGNIYTLKPNEYGIIREFGRIVEVVEVDGLHTKKPFVQRLTKMPKNVLFYDVPATEINTLDKKRILVDYYTL